MPLCPTGMHLLNEGSWRGDVVKPGEVSLGLGTLWVYGFSSSNELPSWGTGMTGLVCCGTQQTHLRKAFYSFAWNHFPTLVPASAHMRWPKISGLETPSEEKRKLVLEPKHPEEVFISHGSHFRDGLTWGLLPDCKVNGPYLNLNLWKDRRCLDKVLSNISVFINVRNESRRTLVSDISWEQTIDLPWVAAWLIWQGYKPVFELLISKRSQNSSCWWHKDPIPSHSFCSKKSVSS